MAIESKYRQFPFAVGIMRPQGGLDESRPWAVHMDQFCKDNSLEYNRDYIGQDSHDTRFHHVFCFANKGIAVMFKMMFG